MQNNINVILTGFSILLCFVLLYFLLFTDFKRQDLDGTKRTIFVVILLAYAVFRSYRLYKQIKLSNQETDDEI